MVSKSFDIHTANLQPFDTASRKLVLEITPEMVNVILVEKQSGELIAIEVFSGPHEEKGDWDSIFQQSRLLSYRELETLVFVATPYMIPIPASLYHPQVAKSQLALFFGGHTHSTVSGDVLKEQEMVVAWQIPDHIHEMLKGHFAFFQIKHVISSLVQTPVPGDISSGFVVVYATMAWVLLWTMGKLQVAKPIHFKKPDDLSWELLNLCRQISIEPEAITWRMSGAVEDRSPLWQGATRFLDQVEPLNAGVKLPDNLPPHYFAHLFI